MPFRDRGAQEGGMQRWGRRRKRAPDSLDWAAAVGRSVVGSKVAERHAEVAA
jgi:hypothetical protein